MRNNLKMMSAIELCSNQAIYPAAFVHFVIPKASKQCMSNDSGGGSASALAALD